MAPEILLGQCGEGRWRGSDVWAVGCMLPELCTNTRLIKYDVDDDDDDGLISIFEKMGTPDEQSWPGVTSLKNWAHYVGTYPTELTLKCEPPPPEEMLTWLGRAPSDGDPFDKRYERLAADLLDCLLTLSPSSRLTAHAALHHDFFSDAHGSTAPVPLGRYVEAEITATQRGPGGRRAKRMRPA